MPQLEISAEIVEDYDRTDAPKSIDNKTYIVIDGLSPDDWEEGHDLVCEQIHGLLREDCNQSPLGVGVVDDIEKDLPVAVPHSDDVHR